MRDGDARDETEIAVSALLHRGLEILQLETTETQIGQLTALVLLLSRWAARINLTGHRDPVSIATRLVLDAAALSKAVPELARAESLADLGSGAGFPGLPLAILNPSLCVHLVESRLKRNHFQRAACRVLELTRRVEPILGRSDRIEARAVDIVVAQAMTQPREALELMQAWTRPGGLMILPASENAEKPRPASAHGPIEERSYRVPESGIQRKLWVTRVPEV